MSETLDAFERNNSKQGSSLDPLGERRIAAKRFWLEDGSPEQTDWSKYWEKADSLFSAATGMRMHLRDHSQDVDKSSSSIKKLSGKHPLIISIAEVLSINGSEHDLLCVAIILHTSVLALADNIALGPYSVEEVQEILQQLEGLCGANITKEMIANIATKLRADHALSNHDRTTIARISQELLKNNRVNSIVPTRKTVAVVETADGTKKEKEIY